MKRFKLICVFLLVVGAASAQKKLPVTVVLPDKTTPRTQFGIDKMVAALTQSGYKVTTVNKFRTIKNRIVVVVRYEKPGFKEGQPSADSIPKEGYRLQGYRRLYFVSAIDQS